jgi:hypothetical protein
MDDVWIETVGGNYHERSWVQADALVKVTHATRPNPGNPGEVRGMSQAFETQGTHTFAETGLPGAGLAFLESIAQARVQASKLRTAVTISWLDKAGEWRTETVEARLARLHAEGPVRTTP